MILHPSSLVATSRRRLLAIGGVGLAAWALAGCTTQPGLGDSPQELQTASDETDARRRARTRLALATGYYENGQHTVALDEQKKALQADPNFGDAYNLGGLIYMALGDQALAQSLVLPLQLRYPRGLGIDCVPLTTALAWRQPRQGRGLALTPPGSQVRGV